MLSRLRSAGTTYTGIGQMVGTLVQLRRRLYNTVCISYEYKEECAYTPVHRARCARSPPKPTKPNGCSSHQVFVSGTKYSIVRWSVS